MDLIPVFLNCPRCGDRGYERLQTYSHCVACLYSPVFEEEPNVPEWAARLARQAAKEFSKSHARKEQRTTPAKPGPVREPAPMALRVNPTAIHVFNIL